MLTSKIREANKTGDTYLEKEMPKSLVFTDDCLSGRPRKINGRLLKLIRNHPFTN